MCKDVSLARLLEGRAGVLQSFLLSFYGQRPHVAPGFEVRMDARIAHPREDPIGLGPLKLAPAPLAISSAK